MYHTHRAKTSLRLRKPRLLNTIYNRWALASILCLSLQIIAGFRPAVASSDSPSIGTFELLHEQGDFHAIQLDAQIDVSVTGLLADVTITQTFKNTSQQWLDGRYLFPMHEDSAIQGLTMRIGERSIVGKIMPRQEAKDTFEDAKAAGQIASLVEQQRPNLFTMEASAIAPDDLIIVELAVMLPISIRDGKMELRLPTTLTPRYTGEN